MYIIYALYTYNIVLFRHHIIVLWDIIWILYAPLPFINGTFSKIWIFEQTILNHRHDGSISMETLHRDILRYRIVIYIIRILYARIKYPKSVQCLFVSRDKSPLLTKIWISDQANHPESSTRRFDFNGGGRGSLDFCRPVLRPKR